MHSLILPSRFSGQPQYPARIYQGRSLSKGLAFYVVPALGDLVKRSPITAVGSGVVRGVGLGGVGVKAANASAGQSLACGSVGTAYSLLVLCNTIGLSGTQNLIDDDDGVTRAFQFRTNVTGSACSVDFIPFNASNTPVVVTKSGLTTKDNVCFVATITSSGAATLWCERTKTTGSLGATPRAPASSLYLLNRKSVGTGFLGNLYLAAGWNRALTDSEVLSLFDNPWQVLQKPERKIWVPSVGSGAQTLTPTLFTNSNTFYSPTATPGQVTLTPSLFSNDQAFYAATVTQAGAPQTLTAGLFSNSNSFYAHTLTTNYGLVATLHTNSQTFYPPTVSPGAVALTPGLFTNSQTFYLPVVTQDGGPQYVTPDLYSSSQTFYWPTVTPGPVALTATRLDNTQAFYAHVVSQAGGTQTLLPDLLINAQSFYAPTVSGGSALFTPEQLAYILAYVEANMAVPTVEEIAAAVIAALNATTIPVNVKQFNSNPISGTGRPGDPVTAT